MQAKHITLTRLHTDLRSMKKKQYLKANIKISLVLVALSLSFLAAWRDILVFWEYHNKNVITATSECISVSQSRTNELRLHSFFTIFCLNFEDGTVVAIYSETANELFLSENATEQLRALEERFVTGFPITFTYVAKPTIVNDTYALVCASLLDGTSLIDATSGISHYARRAKTIVITSLILYSFSFLSFVAPLFFRLYKKWNHRRKRIRRKER